VKAKDMFETLIKNFLPATLVFGIAFFALACFLFLVGSGVFTLPAKFGTFDTTTPIAKLIVYIVALLFLVLSVILLCFSLALFAFDKIRGRTAQRRKDYEHSMKSGDLDRANAIHRQQAIEKLRSSKLSKARLGLQEIIEHGSELPFEAGFNALTSELARRRKWSLRFEILDALIIVAEPIRKQFSK
jgi:hypothetical protein